MGNPDAGKRYATVDGTHCGSVQHVDRVLVLRVGIHFHVIPRTGLDNAFGIDLLPRLSRVIGAIQPALVIRRLYYGKHAFRVGARNIYADLTHEIRQTLVQLVPRVAAVCGLPDAAAVAAGLNHPRTPQVIPERGVEDARVVHVHRQVTGSRSGPYIKNTVPRLSTVRGSIHAPVLGLPIGRTLHRHIHQIGIGGMDTNAGDGAR